MGLSEAIAFGSLVLSLVVILLNSRKDSRSDAAKEARTDAKLDNISNGVSEIRLDMRAMTKRLDAHDTKLTQLEGREQEDRRRIETLETNFAQAHPPA